MGEGLPAVEIFTDGACSGNPGPGGWGAILRYNEVEKEISGGEAQTTNNRMEMMAAIAALADLPRLAELGRLQGSKHLHWQVRRPAPQGLLRPPAPSAATQPTQLRPPKRSRSPGADSR